MIRIGPRFVIAVETLVTVPMVTTLSASRLFEFRRRAGDVPDHMHTSTTHPRSQHRTTHGAIALIAIVWLVYATVRPETTLHLGPVLLPLLPLVVEPAGTNRVPSVLIGAGSAVGVLVVLAGTGSLNGPAIEPFTNAAMESATALIVATLAGLGLASITR